MRAYLVTGGAGFIGSHIAAALAAQGEAVTVLDDLSSGRRENLEALGGRVRVVEGDACDPRAVREGMEGAAAVFHEAAVPSVERSFQDPCATLRANARGTLQVLLAARDLGVGRVVVASSSSIYGNAPALPKREEMSPDPLSPYALSKWTAEQYVDLAVRLWHVDAVALRYFNVFGERQDPESPYAAVIPRFVRAAIGGEPPVICGDGLQTRDFTYVGNVVEANLLAARARIRPGLVMNVCSGVRTSLLDLLGILARITGRRLEPRFEPARSGDVRDSVGDFSRAREAIGYEPRIGLEEGLARVIAWMGRRLAAAG